jgi:hypothetical protein
VNIKQSRKKAKRKLLCTFKQECHNVLELCIDIHHITLTIVFSYPNKCSHPKSEDLQCFSSRFQWFKPLSIYTASKIRYQYH